MHTKLELFILILILCAYLILTGCATVSNQSNEMQIKLPVHEVCKFNRLGIILHRKIQQVVFECSL